MRLCLRAQDIAWTTIGLSDKSRVVHCERQVTRPETILNLIVASLNRWKIGWSQIDSLAVVVGTGSFTALRSSLTVVNTIAFARSLPIASIKIDPLFDDELAFAKLAKAKVKANTWVIPRYGAPALITKPKRRATSFQSLNRKGRTTLSEKTSS